VNAFVVKNAARIVRRIVFITEGIIGFETV
jgi:hypothetical protein